MNHKWTFEKFISYIRNDKAFNPERVLKYFDRMNFRNEVLIPVVSVSPNINYYDPYNKIIPFDYVKVTKHEKQLEYKFLDFPPVVFAPKPKLLDFNWPQVKNFEKYSKDWNLYLTQACNIGVQNPDFVYINNLEDPKIYKEKKLIQFENVTILANEIWEAIFEEAWTGLAFFRYNHIGTLGEYIKDFDIIYVDIERHFTDNYKEPWPHFGPDCPLFTLVHEMLHKKGLEHETKNDYQAFTELTNESIQKLWEKVM